MYSLWSADVGDDGGLIGVEIERWGDPGKGEGVYITTPSTQVSSVHYLDTTVLSGYSFPLRLFLIAWDYLTFLHITFHLFDIFLVSVNLAQFVR